MMFTGPLCCCTMFIISTTLNKFLRKRNAWLESGELKLHVEGLLQECQLRWLPHGGKNQDTVQKLHWSCNWICGESLRPECQLQWLPYNSSEQYALHKLNHLNKGSYYYQSNHCTPASRSSFSLSWCKLVTTWTYLDLLRRLFQSTTICPLVAEPDNSTVHGQIVEALMTCLSRATAMATGSHAIQSCTL